MTREELDIVTATTEVLEAIADQIKTNGRQTEQSYDLEVLSKISAITDALHDLIRTQDVKK